MRSLLKKLICKIIGHDITYVMKGVVSDLEDGCKDVTFTDDQITFRCERCAIEREPTDDERNEAMKELLIHHFGGR